MQLLFSFFGNFDWSRVYSEAALSAYSIVSLACPSAAQAVPWRSLVRPTAWHQAYSWMRCRNFTAFNVELGDRKMQYWLMKSEPSDASIDDVLASPNQTIPWYGVRNYQARNFMRDLMRIGDGVLFYHSSCAEPGIAGIAEVASVAFPDSTQFDRGGKYYDPKATPENPRWMMVDVRAVKKTQLMSLAFLREEPELAEMQILRRGNRLSITRVEVGEWRWLIRHLKDAS